MGPKICLRNYFLNHYRLLSRTILNPDLGFTIRKIYYGMRKRRAKRKLQFNESIPFIGPSSQCGVSSMQSRVIGGVDAKIGSWPWQVCFIFKYLYLFLEQKFSFQVSQQLHVIC